MNTATLDAFTVTGGLSAPDVSKLTAGTLTGTGVFDQLIAAVKLHLQEEYDSQRITSDQYAEIYLGALQSTMQFAVQYVINHPAEEETLARIGHIRQQTVTELAKTCDNLNLGLGFNNSSTLEGTMALELSVLTKEAALKDEQLNTATAETDLTKQKVVTELAQTDDDFTKVSTYGTLNTTANLAGVLNEHILKSAKERDLIEQKMVSEIAQYNDVLPANQEAGGIGFHTTVLGSVIKASIDKTAGEIQLLAQKAITEYAQTGDTAIGANNGVVPAGYALGGVVDKQKTLYTNQANGFIRDAEQKLLKIMSEPLVASIAAESGDVTDSLMDNAHIAQVVTEAFEGLGLTPTP